MSKLKVTVGILTWRSYDTLRNTLSSYKNNGLLDIVDEVIVFAQDLSSLELDICREFSTETLQIKIIGSSGNIGIGNAFKHLVHYSTNKYVLILENDWVLIEDRSMTRSQIDDGIKLLLTKQADFIKYRSRNNPGEPLYTRQFAGREMDSPPHLFECVHWREHPDKDYPDKIFKISGLYSDWYVCDSKWANHTNNPFMVTKDFYNNNIAPFSGQGVDLEGNIFEWWQQQGFKVAHSTGLFKHERLDR